VEKVFSSNNIAAQNSVAANNDSYSTTYANNVTLYRNQYSYAPGQLVNFSLQGDYTILNDTIEELYFMDPTGNTLFNTSRLVGWPKVINSTGDLNQTSVVWEGHNLSMYWNLKNDTTGVYVNVTFELPTYPVNLGLWLFNIDINNTNDARLRYRMKVQVLDSISYSRIDTYALRGGNETYAIYEKENYLDTLSLGDNITLHSRLAYGNTSELINTSITPISGIVQLKKDGEVVYDDIGLLRTFNATHASDIAHGNITGGTVNDTAINFAIPIDNSLYGNYTVSLKLTFEDTLASHVDWKFNTTIDMMETAIKYRVLVDSFTSLENTTSFSLTKDIAGFVSFKATHWNTSLDESYPQNITLELPIAVNELTVVPYATEVDNQTEIPHMFSLEFIGKNRAQWSSFFYQSYSIGDYALKFRWLTALEVDDESGTLNSYEDLPSENTFSWNFSLTVQYGITASETNILLETSETTAILRFRIIITTTNRTVYAEQNIRVLQDGTLLQYSFNEATGEYLVVVNAVEGTQTLTIEFAGDSEFSMDPNTVTYNIEFVEPFETEEPVPTVQNKDISLIDLAILGVLIVMGLFSFVGVYFLRRL